MRIVPVLALALGSLVAASPVASADDLSFGVSFRSGGHGHGKKHRRHRDHDGFSAFVAVGLDALAPPRRHAPPPVVVRRARPVVVPVPVPVVADDDCCRTVWIPERVCFHEEVVTEPAVWDTRCVPVYEDVCVPVYEEVCEPVYQEVCDPVTGEVARVKVGERHRQVRVGERTERVQVGERTERVLVRPETTRVVRVPETIPGRFLKVCDHGHGHGGDVLTPDAYEAMLAEPAPRAAVAFGFSARR